MMAIRRQISVSEVIGGGKFDIDQIEKLTKSDMSTEDRRLLIDYISDEFARNGLRQDDEPTEYGLKLECLIDKLNHR